MGYHHEASHHGHDHGYKNVALQRLGWSLAITAVVMLVEAVGGWLVGSIALISDAGHMLTHAFAIGVSIFGIKVARLPACHHRTFGLLRAEVLAALINGIFLVLISVWIVIESVQRFMEPREILTAQMTLIALLGLVVNVVSIALLRGSRHKDLNIRSVFLHMIGDAVSSVALVVAAFVIRFTHWFWLDPLLSIAIAVWIVIWAAGLLKESGRVLLEMAPKDQNVHRIATAMKERFPIITETSHEHLWTITEEVIVFSAHLGIRAGALSTSQMKRWLEEVEHWLSEEFGIVESTLQVNFLDVALTPSQDS